MSLREIGGWQPLMRIRGWSLSLYIFVGGDIVGGDIVGGDNSGRWDVRTDSSVLEYVWGITIAYVLADGNRFVFLFSFVGTTYCLSYSIYYVPYCILPKSLPKRPISDPPRQDPPAVIGRRFADLKTCACMCDQPNK